MNFLGVQICLLQLSPRADLVATSWLHVWQLDTSSICAFIPCQYSTWPLLLFSAPMCELCIKLNIPACILFGTMTQSPLNTIPLAIDISSRQFQYGTVVADVSCLIFGQIHTSNLVKMDHFMFHFLVLLTFYQILAMIVKDLFQILATLDLSFHYL